MNILYFHYINYCWLFTLTINILGFFVTEYHRDIKTDFVRQRETKITINRTSLFALIWLLKPAANLSFFDTIMNKIILFLLEVDLN